MFGIVLSVGLFALTYAAPPIVPVELGAKCVDGVNNVIKIDDVSEGSLVIHAKDVVAQTYDVHGKPSCYGGRASVSLPGKIKLVKGQIVVSAANANIKSAEMRLWLKKNSIFVGTICNDGVRGKNMVPPDVCHHPIYPDIGDPFLKMLSTPGTYDLEAIEKEAHQGNVINLPPVKGIMNTVARGDWQAQFAIVLGGKRIAHIKAPSNTPWLYVN